MNSPMGHSGDTPAAPAADPATVPLWRCPVMASSLEEFARSHAGLLAPHERTFLWNSLQVLAEPKDSPIDFAQGLTGNAALSAESEPAVMASRSGARSALLSGHAVQLKGCRPDPEAGGFPLERLPFGGDRAERTTIPFGVMTAEAVLREILGYCFMRDRSLPYQATPLFVWEYEDRGTSLGYCLATRVAAETRVESLLVDPGCTIGELIEAQRRGPSKAESFVPGSEIGLRNLNLWSWVESKARTLCGMHYGGGFRGILNSNIGNDVLPARGQGRGDILLCDFDTFFMVELPQKPDRAFLDAYCLECLVEVIIGSLPILQYVDLPKGCSPADRADILGAVYFPKSSLWRSYHRRFFASAKAAGWDLDAVDDSLGRMRRTEACADMLAVRVLSAYYLEKFGARTIFFPHN